MRCHCYRHSDASEDSLRACLGQIAGNNEALAERALHILEGLNAASSAGETAAGAAAASASAAGAAASSAGAEGAGAD